MQQRLEQLNVLQAFNPVPFDRNNMAAAWNQGSPLQRNNPAPPPVQQPQNQGPPPIEQPPNPAQPPREQPQNPGQQQPNDPAFPNLDPARGLCNGSRGILTRMSSWVPEIQLISGDHSGTTAFIPHISVTQVSMVTKNIVYAEVLLN